MDGQLYVFPQMPYVRTIEAMLRVKMLQTTRAVLSGRDQLVEGQDGRLGRCGRCKNVVGVLALFFCTGKKNHLDVRTGEVGCDCYCDDCMSICKRCGMRTICTFCRQDGATCVFCRSQQGKYGFLARYVFYCDAISFYGVSRLGFLRVQTEVRVDEGCDCCAGFFLGRTVPKPRAESRRCDRPNRRDV